MPVADRTAHDMELYSMAVGVGCPGGLTPFLLQIHLCACSKEN